MKGFLDWLDARTGCRRIGRYIFFEAIPGGPHWRHVWLSLVLFAFFVQVVTGLSLLAFYSPSSHTAWESVFHLQYEITGGALLRGTHSIMAQAFVVLVAIHIFQVVLYRAYLAPREIPFLLSLLVLPLAIAQSTTGWLLPFDQKGYWAARVPLNILGATPILGPSLRTLLVGGGDIGSYTLTHFVALHAVLLPFVMGLVLVLCWILSRRQVGASSSAPLDSKPYWPDQSLRDALACMVLLVIVVAWTSHQRFRGAGNLGVELFAPADSSEQYAAARPEWFMLWLFQFLKLFPGRTEVWGAIVLPTLAFITLAALPWIGRRKAGQVFGVAFCGAIFAGAVILTMVARTQDRRNPNYQAALIQARASAERAQALAQAPAGIPLSGALELMRNDPLTEGPKLFSQKCASCHRFDGHDGMGREVAAAQSASELKSFASRAWLSGVLDPSRIVTTNYFGATSHLEGKMVRFVTEKAPAFDAAKKEGLKSAIVALSAEAQLKSQSELDQRDAAVIEAGKKFIGETCADCHPFHKRDEDASGPDLTGYGSRNWLMRFIADPAHADFYGERNDRMPAFKVKQILTEREIGLIADWLRGEWYEPRK